jgi:hypothetical protein
MTSARGRRTVYGALALVSLLGLFPLTGAAAAPAASGPQVSIAAVSGEQGHAFVYAQVTDLLGAHPAPPGSSPTPYYSRWQAVPIGSPSCPWIWLIFVYDRDTNRQLNAPPAGLPAPFPSTTTFFCPGPRISPVAAPQLAIAQARLDLDLGVAASPAHPLAGSAVTVTGRLEGSALDDMGLLLSMAIDDWHVDAWRFDFGDGSQARAPGPARLASTTHVYQSGAVYRAAVSAAVSGNAQAAEYAPSGYPFLVRRAFTVQVANGRPVPVAGFSIQHVPPVVTAAVSPVIDGSGVPTPVGLRRIEVPRGRLVDLFLRPEIVRPGFETRNGAFSGWGRSSVTGWRWRGGSGQPPDRVLPDSGWLPVAAPLALQWDSPDALAGGRPQDYPVWLQLRVATRYPDGVTQQIILPAAVDASVLYTAQND